MKWRNYGVMFASKYDIVIVSVIMTEAFRCDNRKAFLFSRKGGFPMPYKPKRPCSYPGCPLLTTDRFCEEHKRKEAKRYEKYQRDPTTKKRYNRSWKHIRDNYIKAHPLCELCKKNGHLTPAQEVHHIVPLTQGGAHDFYNLMSLCKSCHSTITAREGGRWGK